MLRVPFVLITVVLLMMFSIVCELWILSLRSVMAMIYDRLDELIGAQTNKEMVL